MMPDRPGTFNAPSEQIEELLALIPGLEGADVRTVPLSGGITNHNYHVTVDADEYVLRLGGKNSALLGIDRTRELACSMAAAELGIGPAVVASSPERDALITRFVRGRVITAEDAKERHTLERMLDALRRFHNGPSVPGRFSPYETIRGYYSLAQDYAVLFPESMSRALQLLDSIEQSPRRADPSCPCHNDLLPSNFIDDRTAMWIIDWEYAAMGDLFFDLGNLAVNHALDESGEHLLLELYFGDYDPDHLRRLRLMRLVSDMRESLWGFLQSAISTLDFDFLGYGQSHLERFMTAADAFEAGRLRSPA